MSLLNACVDGVRRDVALAEMTWFGLGGSARYFVSPLSRDHLCDVLGFAADQGLRVRVLGGGANVLVRDDGFDGLVIRLDREAFCSVDFEGETVIAAGGADLMLLSRDCAQMGLGGLEFMAGIPGTVGGAVTMNAGGRYGQFSDVLAWVELMDRTGCVRRVTPDQLDFGYRRSNVGDRIVLGAALRLKRTPKSESVARFQRIWREKKESQPFADHSAGCTFKNPPGQIAGRLIEQAGLKGASMGRARVSDRHANFIVADRGAVASDVLALADMVRDRVKRKTGVVLEMEVDVW